MHDLFQLSGKVIDGTGFSCLGPQLARVVVTVSHVRTDLTWYAADVETNLGDFPACGPEAVFVGSSAKLVELADKVDQFLYGVFLAVDAGLGEPRFRSVIDTEDSVDADLGDAVIEVRAFDTTYLEVHICDEAVSDRISQMFGVAPLRNTPVG